MDGGRLTLILFIALILILVLAVVWWNKKESYTKGQAKSQPKGQAKSQPKNRIENMNKQVALFPFGVSKITDDIYLGDAATGASSKKFLKEHGITHIVNAAAELPNYFPDDFTYQRLDLYDKTSQTLGPALPKAYDFIKDALKDGGKIFIHCIAGISRSASVTIYYLMRDQGWKYRKAYTFVKDKRPIINPNESFKGELLTIQDNLKVE